MRLLIDLPDVPVPMETYGMVNESSIIHGSVTGNGNFLGIPLNYVEKNRGTCLLYAALATCIACCISIFNIYRHLQHYTRPPLQRYIVRILVIVPVYALGSLLSLKFVNHALYFDTLRDIYEAFVVYSFLALVLSFAGGESVCVLKMQSEPEIIHVWPLNKYFTPIQRDGRLLRSCKRATIQFVVIKPIFGILSLVMLVGGQYHTWEYQLILIVVYNLSYTIALYGLWLFYLATKHILKTFNPVLKFFAVKSVIFLTFWQSGALDMIPSITREQSFAWKDYILCLEMVLFALLHYLAFPPSQFHQEQLDRLPDSEVLKNMKEVLSFTDIFIDAYHNFMPWYSDYMLQRPDASSRNNTNDPMKSTTKDHQLKRTKLSRSRSGLDSPEVTNVASNGWIPRFVIDDEEDDDTLPGKSSPGPENLSPVDKDDEVQMMTENRIEITDEEDLEHGIVPSTTIESEIPDTTTQVTNST